MARIWKATWSCFFNTVPLDADVVTETPEHYLMHTKKGMERLSLLFDQAPKFNQEQCKYLAGKLDIALQSACSIIKQFNTWYFSSASPEEKVGCLEIFKLLLLMRLEAEGFIQDCYKDEWIQKAIMLTKVSEHVVSMGFNLELCTIIFSNRKSGIPTSLTPIEVTNLRQAEAEIVKEKSDLDEKKLCLALSDVTRLRLSSSTDWQLATFLLGRIKSGRLEPGVGSIFSMKNLNRMESLGIGASGIVHRATWLGTEVAKKTFHGPSNPDFLQEVSILAGLSHPNIVSLLWYTTDQRKSHLIMELMEGDLSTLMEKRSEEYGDHGSPFSILESFDLLLQTAEGMLYLHEKRIVHRDLKSNNILVKSVKARELDFKHVQVKVADFGLSKTKEKSLTHSQQTPNMGTTRWMAPEMMALRNEVEPQYPFKSDVYSFGMVCFEILTGDVPFSTLSPREVRNVVLGGGRPRLPAVCPSRLRTLIEACWSEDPSRRPHFRDICAQLRHLKCEHLVTSAVEVAAQERSCSASSPCPATTDCCSKYDFCGTSDAFCGPGCVNGPCTGTPTPPSGGVGAGWSSFFTESNFNSWFPNRNSFYTFQAFSDATSAYPAFGTSGSTDDQKREIAAFFGNVQSESGGLQFINEISPPDMYCEANAQYPCAEGKSYYGRGPLQLSWTYNYGECGVALGLNLLADPDQVAQNGGTAFKTALWFWMTRKCHDAILRSSFASTNRIISGMECGHGFDQRVENRVNAYLGFCQTLQVDPGSDLRC